VNYLITGVSGQIGSYLLEHLAGKDQVIGICRHIRSAMDIPENARIVSCDVNSYDDVYEIFSKYRPERIFHLATYHFRGGPWSAPQEVMKTNVIGTLNLLEAVRALHDENANYDPVIVITGTAMCYGESLKALSEPVKEDAPLRPTTPYALSKTAQEMLAAQYFQTHGIKTIRARLFAVTGPRADHGSVYDFTRKAVMIERGVLPIELEVGDTNVYRSITDARDVVSALALLADSSAYGEVFNLCGSEYILITDVLEMIKSRSSKPFEVITRADLFPASDRFLVGNSDKLTNTIAWAPRYTLEHTVDDMFSCFRLAAEDFIGTGHSGIIRKI
jgi:nucleoside-diphosphate-sugar epimerase